MNKDQEIVVELIKAWFEKHDASFLAKEGQVVFWENDEWVIWTLRESVNIFKATLIPFGLLKLCDDNAVRVAALELSRSYIAGVNSKTVIQPQYFNFHRDAVKLGTDYGNHKEELVKRTIDLFGRSCENVKLTDIGIVLDYAMNYIEQPALSSHERNELIRKLIVNTHYKERNYKSRYLWEGRMHAVLRYGKVNGLFDIKTINLETIAIQILKGSQAAKQFAKGEMRNLLDVALGR